MENKVDAEIVSGVADLSRTPLREIVRRRLDALAAKPGCDSAEGEFNSSI